MAPSLSKSALVPNRPFDSKKDLAPVVLVGTSPMVLATFAGSDYKTFGDVVNAAKAKNLSAMAASTLAAWGTSP